MQGKVVRLPRTQELVVEASHGQLPGAVVTIANCSHEATALAAYKLAERKSVDETERLYERLITIFPKRMSLKMSIS
jgi:hypothetical protein